MHRIVRLSVYAAIYGAAFATNYAFHRRTGKRPVPVRLLLYVTGLMFSVAIVEEFH